jgi:hypothetical protein
MESTLMLRLPDLQVAVGVFAGWGSDSEAWSATETAIILDCVQSGLSRFYFPEPQFQNGVTYEWSFLKPLGTAPFPAGATVADLPDDYNSIEGPVTIQAVGVVSQPYKIWMVNPGIIEEKYSIYATQTGPPMFCAILPIKGTSPDKSQRMQLYLFPQADMDYILQFQYSINPNMLTTDAPYAYGGAQHAETIKESCLAVFEERYDDTPGGPHSMAFTKRMLASIGMDRRNKSPRAGYNRDASDERGYGFPGPWWHFSAPAATYNCQSLC